MLGNANTQLSIERRKSLLLKIDPKLASLASKDEGPSAKGQLFGDSFIKELGKYVSTFATLAKAQLSIKKNFSSQVFAKAGKGRGRFAGRSLRGQYTNRDSYNQQSQLDTYTGYKPRFYPRRSRGYRHRGYVNKGEQTSDLENGIPEYVLRPAALMLVAQEVATNESVFNKVALPYELGLTEMEAQHSVSYASIFERDYLKNNGTQK
ncbi:hypothetical protein NDU88_005830 [Pleurodeles waltl]|uniref:Uncharacterized protein n=1 Tax=Pleurodeles waltl TaxID=8319 RepID=A0AAV7PLK5_PLEWA|nr:hypothetical protein NDU88_005830 [Pleurodeles waltl]